MGLRKINPGLVLLDSVSFKHNRNERAKIRSERIDYISKTIPTECLAGYSALMTFGELWDSLDNMERALDAAGNTGKQLVVRVKDRNFGNDKYNLPIPGHLKKHGSWFEGNTHFGALWHDDYVQAYVELCERVADKFGDHDAFARFEWSETTVSHKAGGCSDRGYRAAMERLHKGAAEALAKKGVWFAVIGNYYPGGAQKLYKLWSSANTHGNVVYSFPDLVPSHFAEYEGPYIIMNRGNRYTVDGYVAARKIGLGRKGFVMPRIDTYDMRKGQEFESIRLAVEHMNAVQFVPQSSFDSRRDKESAGYPQYIDDWLVPCCEQMIESGLMETMRDSVAATDKAIAESKAGDVKAGSGGARPEAKEGGRSTYAYQHERDLSDYLSRPADLVITTDEDWLKIQSDDYQTIEVIAADWRHITLKNQKLIGRNGRKVIRAVERSGPVPGIGDHPYHADKKTVFPHLTGTLDCNDLVISGFEHPSSLRFSPSVRDGRYNNNIIIDRPLLRDQEEAGGGVIHFKYNARNCGVQHPYFENCSVHGEGAGCAFGSERGGEKYPGCFVIGGEALNINQFIQWIQQQDNDSNPSDFSGFIAEHPVLKYDGRYRTDKSGNRDPNGHYSEFECGLLEAKAAALREKAYLIDGLIVGARNCNDAGPNNSQSSGVKHPRGKNKFSALKNLIVDGLSAINSNFFLQMYDGTRPNSEFRNITGYECGRYATDNGNYLDDIDALIQLRNLGPGNVAEYLRLIDCHDGARIDLQGRGFRKSGIVVGKSGDVAGKTRRVYDRPITNPTHFIEIPAGDAQERIVATSEQGRIHTTLPGNGDQQEDQNPSPQPTEHEFIVWRPTESDIIRRPGGMTWDSRGTHLESAGGYNAGEQENYENGDVIRCDLANMLDHNQWRMWLEVAADPKNKTGSDSLWIKPYGVDLKNGMDQYVYDKSGRFEYQEFQDPTRSAGSNENKVTRTVSAADKELLFFGRENGFKLRKVIFVRAEEVAPPIGNAGYVRVEPLPAAPEPIVEPEPDEPAADEDTSPPSDIDPGPKPVLCGRIVDYDLVAHSEVQGSIAEGWQPWGSPVFTLDGDVLQAIVKYLEDDA